MQTGVALESPAAALRRAVDALDSQVATAKLLGVTQGAVSKWVRKGMSLPAEHVIAIETETKRRGREVSRYELRPDIYPPADRRELRRDQHDGAGLEPAR